MRLPDDWLDARAAIYAWAAAGVDPVVVIWTPQDAPSPPRPYLSLNVIAPPSGIGAIDEKRYRDDEEDPEEVLVEDTGGDRELTVSIQAYTDGAAAQADAEALLLRLHDRLYTSAVLAAFSAADLAVVRREPVTAAPAIAGAAWEGRAAFELRLRARSLVSSEVPWIEHAAVVGSIED